MIQFPVLLIQVEDSFSKLHADGSAVETSQLDAVQKNTEDILSACSCRGEVLHLQYTELKVQARQRGMAAVAGIYGIGDEGGTSRYSRAFLDKHTTTTATSDHT